MPSSGTQIVGPWLQRTLVLGGVLWLPICRNNAEDLQLSFAEIVQEFRGWIDAGDQQVIAGAGASHVQ